MYKDKQIINKVIYLALSVELDCKEVLFGMWLSENEDDRFRLGVLTELQNAAFNTFSLPI